jgi:hypothetical protein
LVKAQIWLEDVECARRWSCFLRRKWNREKEEREVVCVFKKLGTFKSVHINAGSDTFVRNILFGSQRGMTREEGRKVAFLLSLGKVNHI